MTGDGDRPFAHGDSLDETQMPPVPTWVTDSSSMSDAYALAKRAQGLERRPSDERLFLEHVSEVGKLLYWIRAVGVD
jgi:hypothetical protein